MLLEQLLHEAIMIQSEDVERLDFIGTSDLSDEI